MNRIFEKNYSNEPIRENESFFQSLRSGVRWIRASPNLPDVYRTVLPAGLLEAAATTPCWVKSPIFMRNSYNATRWCDVTTQSGANKPGDCHLRRRRTIQPGRSRVAGGGYNPPVVPMLRAATIPDFKDKMTFLLLTARFEWNPWHKDIHTSRPS